MAVDGNTTADFKFWDEDRNREIEVTLTIKDGILLKLLDKIARRRR